MGRCVTFQLCIALYFSVLNSFCILGLKLSNSEDTEMIEIVLRIASLYQLQNKVLKMTPRLSVLVHYGDLSAQMSSDQITFIAVDIMYFQCTF